MNRRDFLKTGMAGIAFLSLKTLGCSSGSDNYVGTEFELTIGAGLFEMVDGQKVFMWSFEDQQGVPRMPGPVIQVKEGDPVRIHVHNTLQENHAFAVLGVAGTSTGEIKPGNSTYVTFTAPPAGTYLYADPLNSPVNRVLGLHGAMIVTPKTGNTPYSSPSAAVQQLFNDLGTTPQFPKNAKFPAGWQRDRDRIWLMNQIDPRFTAQAQADFQAGRSSRVSAADIKANFLPRYFTINGKSGAFASHDPDITIEGLIGQPMLVRILNAGLFTHSNHLHANHFYVTAENGTVRDNVFFLDSYHIFPEDRVDWLVPFVRPPDIAGDQSIQLRDLIPEELALVLGDVPQSPLGYPMHCHMEPSQTAAGGNYPQGVVTHFDFLGDVDGVEFPHSTGM
ncbi:MAG TPA: multicopper oxidase domain-containing protein [Geobacteraceae bacterium]